MASLSVWLKKPETNPEKGEACLDYSFLIINGFCSFFRKCSNHNSISNKSFITICTKSTSVWAYTKTPGPNFFKLQQFWKPSMRGKRGFAPGYSLIMPSDFGLRSEKRLLNVYWYLTVTVLILKNKIFRLDRVTKIIILFLLEE